MVKTDNCWPCAARRTEDGSIHCDYLGIPLTDGQDGKYPPCINMKDNI